jgi:glutamine cyclotransferase
MSDGTNQIRFLDPSNFKAVRTIKVFDAARPLMELNELEYIKGEIYANIWQTNRIARIAPASGEVLAWVDLDGLLKIEDNTRPVDVLNGIAYDEANDRLFVTGKLWPKLFEIQLKKKGSSDSGSQSDASIAASVLVSTACLSRAGRLRASTRPA